MRRFYSKIASDHLRNYRQMLFLMGPRQVGKTTICQSLADRWPSFYYLSWDDPDVQAMILAGPSEVAGHCQLSLHAEAHPLLAFDEIHKHRRWKLFLKGLYDTYPDRMRILVTGSARLDVYQRGSDSLMGRYFPYRVHPLSVAELITPDEIAEEVRAAPSQIDSDLYDSLLRFGGFPDPFLRSEMPYYRRWSRTRDQQLFREDIRDLTQVQELAQFELLAQLLKHQIGQLTSYASLARKVRVNDGTIRKWLRILASVYYLYEVRPWTKNVTRSLLREPKYYLWDWSQCEDPGQRAENFIASHLLKAVHFWTDHGLGEYGLHYVRDKQKREVDFLVSRDGKPWLLVEVKQGNGQSLSPALVHFRQQLQPEHTLQVVVDLPYVDRSCFETDQPLIVPAKTFLSQLV